MAKKETPAERAVRENLQYEAEYAAFVETYPARFAALLFDYMNLEYAGFRVKRLDAETYLFTGCLAWSTTELKVSPPANRNWEVVSALEETENYVDMFAQEQEEAARKHEAKKAALNKLTKEERELLGL